MTRYAPSVAAALLSGIIFGLGLALAQMTDPQKVMNFLDFTAIGVGGWDPSLALVMGAAVVTAFPFFRLYRRMARPLAAPEFLVPHAKGFDLRLIGGSLLFGLGWGFSGLCPGPALADLALDPLPALAFVASMLAGSWSVGLTLHTGGFGLALADAPSD